MRSREGPRKSDVGKAGSPSSKKAATSAVSNRHLPAVSRTSSRAARSVHTGVLEPSTSSAISDARFAVAHDIFSDSYATTESTNVGGPEARRLSDCTSDGESVTSPMAREEHNCVPPAPPVKPGKVASLVGKQGASHGAASSKESRFEAEGGPIFSEGSQLLRRRSSSGSTASEPSSKKTPSVAIKSEINSRTLGKAKQQREASSTSAHVGRSKPLTAVTPGVGDAASVASCPTGKPKWAGGSEELVTGLTRKLQLLASELSQSRARESEAQRLILIQNGEIARLREKLNEAKGLEVTNQKREEELVEMAAFVRRLQERVKSLEAQNVVLQLEKGEAAKLEKGEGTTAPEECAMPLDIKRGVGSVTRQLDIEPEMREKSLQEAEQLRGAVSQLTQQLHEMEAFLADYGLTWVGTAGPTYKPLSSMHASGHDSPGAALLQVKPGTMASLPREGQWEPSVSWVPEHPPGGITAGGFDKPSSQTLSSQVAPTGNLSNPVPSWIAAHLQITGALSPKPPSHDTPGPKVDALRSSLSKSNLLSPGTLSNNLSKDGQPDQKVRVDVAALREAIDGLNALAGEGGSTVVTSPGGREHRLQVSGAQLTRSSTTEITQVNVC